MVSCSFSSSFSWLNLCFDYSLAEWNSVHDISEIFRREDLFSASRFFLNVVNLSTCAVVMTNRNQFLNSYQQNKPALAKVNSCKFRQASNHGKMFVESAKLSHGNKQGRLSPLRIILS